MADIIAADDRKKSLFLTQIKFLDEQLEKCQLQCDGLEKRNKELPALYRSLQKDKEDISEYLKVLVVEREKEVQEVKKRLENQQQEDEEHREALRLQHRRQMEELQDRIDELQSQSRITAATLECEEQPGLEELEEQLEQQQADLETLKEEVISDRAAYAATVDSLKRAELDWVMNDNRADRKSVKEKVCNIVQEESAQHGELRETFQLLLDHNEDLWTKKWELLREEKRRHLEIENMKKRYDVLTKKDYRKEVEQLTQQCRHLQDELKKKSTASESLQAEREDLRERLASACEQRHQRGAEAAQLRAELQRESSRRRLLEGVMQDGVTALTHILKDSQKVSEAQWRRLLEILESPVFQRPDSSPGQEPQPSEPEPDRSETLSFATDPLFLMARNRAGDLGFVPGPTWKHTAAACSSGAQLKPDRKHKPSSAACRTKPSHQCCESHVRPQDRSVQDVDS
ncbi:myosin-9-like [Centropristis striata]|uniref:myosin-9-like n=1 Tax=Centropristis striata TaxID=184440 RepID=UPI0027DF422D|nr:myosin-9-like [Centropristis striata]